MSADAEESRWVDKEILRAIDQNGTILPLLVEGKPFLSLADIQHEAVANHEMPSAAFVERLRNAVRDGDEDLPRRPSITAEFIRSLPETDIRNGALPGASVVVVRGAGSATGYEPWWAGSQGPSPRRVEAFRR